MKPKLLGAFGSFIKSTQKSVKEFGSKNSHIISGGIAIVGVVATAVLAYKAYPKVAKIQEEKKEKLDELSETVELTEEETKKVIQEIEMDSLKKMVPVLAPVVTVGLATCGTIAFTVATSARKIAKATSLAATSEIAYKELCDKTKEVVGEEKAQEIENKLAEDKLNKKHGDISDDAADELFEIAVQAKGGNQLYYDPELGRLFRSDDDTLNKAAAETQNILRSNGQNFFMEYNGFYSQLDLPDVGAGRNKGWGYFQPCSTTKTEIELKLNNTTKIGKRSVTILHWVDKPVSEELYKDAKDR